MNTIKKRKVDNTDQKVSANFARLRKERGFILEDVADYIGVSFQQVQKYEKCVNRFGVSHLVKLSKMFDVPFNAFLDGVKENRCYALMTKLNGNTEEIYKHHFKNVKALGNDGIFYFFYAEFDADFRFSSEYEMCASMDDSIISRYNISCDSTLILVFSETRIGIGHYGLDCLDCSTRDYFEREKLADIIKVMLIDKKQSDILNRTIAHIKNLPKEIHDRISESV